MATRELHLTVASDVYEMAEREARLAGTSLADWLESAVRREAIRSDASRLGAWAAQHREVRELHADWAAETEREAQARLDESLKGRPEAP
ncbi:hypothetical protein [Flindersiella endophytica]